MGNLFKVVLVQVLVSSAFAAVDESVRTLIRERVKRSALCPQTGPLGH